MMKNAEKSAIIYINTKWYFLFGCSTIKKERCEVQNQSEEIRVYIRKERASNPSSIKSFLRFSLIVMTAITGLSSPFVAYSAYQNDVLGVKTQMEKVVELATTAENNLQYNAKEKNNAVDISSEELHYMREKKKEIAEQKVVPQAANPVKQEEVPAAAQQPPVEKQESSNLVMSDPFTGQTHPISVDEYHMACMVTEAEGEGTGFDNKLEIAEVIRNRMFNSRYKKASLWELFNAPGQFETVNVDGNVQRSGKRFYWENVPEETKKAVSIAFFQNSATLPSNALGWRGNGTRNEIVLE